VITIRPCSADDFDALCAVCNDAARAYRGVIGDLWKEPYMPEAELRSEIAAGVRFCGAFDAHALVGVMGIQDAGEVDLIRHAYTRTLSQGRGVGGALLEYLRAQTDRPILVGTWRAATWAIRFYERHGFRLVPDDQRAVLLRRYWRISDRQIEESVVMGDARWFARDGAIALQ